MNKKKKLYNIVSELYTCSIYEIDTKGNVLNNIIETHKKIQNIENILKIFNKKEKISILEILNQENESFRTKKLSNKYGNNQYAQMRISQLEKGKRFIVINYGINTPSQEIKEEEQLEELIQLSELDPLTQTLNRRGAWRRIRRMLSQKNKRIGLIFIDVDDLKTINDNKGHAKGDKAIIQVSKKILEMKRDKDIVMRFGGDEFIIILEENSSNRSASRGLANRLVQEFQNNKKLLTTISVGVHVVETKSFSKYINKESKLEKKWLEEIEEADKAVYESKKGGKSKVSTSPSFDKIYS